MKLTIRRNKTVFRRFWIGRHKSTTLFSYKYHYVANLYWVVISISTRQRIKPVTMEDVHGDK